MNSRLTIMVTALSLAALSVPAVAASSNQSTPAIAKAHGSASVHHQARFHGTATPAQVAPETQPTTADCIHVSFPQCGGAG